MTLFHYFYILSYLTDQIKKLGFQIHSSLGYLIPLAFFSQVGLSVVTINMNNKLDNDNVILCSC